jgi:hypothetical protein
MSRFRFSALLVLSLGAVAMVMLRRDRRQPTFVAPPVPAPPEPVVAAEPEPEPVAEVPQPAAPVQQLYPETDGVSDVAPERSYWTAPVAPPAHWSDEPPRFGESQSA